MSSSEESQPPTPQPAGNVVMGDFSKSAGTASGASSAQGAPVISALNSTIAPAPAVPHTAAQNAKMLGETRDLVLEKLLLTLTSSLDKVEDDLFEMAEKATDRELQNTYLEARAQAKVKRSEIETTFKKNFFESFDSRAKGEIKKDADPFAGLELSLLGHEDLEASLAVKNLARKLIGASESEFGPLSQRLSFLLNKEQLKEEENPASPENIAGALQQAFNTLDTDPKTRMTLFKLLERYLAEDLKRIYGEANLHLVNNHQILPQLRVQYRRPVAIGGARLPGVTGGMNTTSAPPPGTPGGPPMTPMGMSMPGEPAGPMDMFAQLQALMASQSGGMGGASMGNMFGPLSALASMPGGLQNLAGTAPGGGQYPMGSMQGMPGMPGMPPGYAMPAGGFLGALSGLQQGTNLEFWAQAGLDPALFAPASYAPASPMMQMPMPMPMPMGDPGGYMMPPVGADGVPGDMMPPGMMMAPAPYVFPSNFVNVARQIRGSQMGAQVPQVDGVTMDIVAMIFDYVFEDRDIPTPIKAVVANLQVPVLKVALADKGFFTQKAHPTRLFLDKLAEIGVGCPVSVTVEDELYVKIDQVVGRVVKEFESDVSLFTRELHDLERWYEDFERKQSEREAAVVKVAEERSQNEAVRFAIEIEVSTRATNATVPMIAQALISETLPPLLEIAHADGGEQGAPWQATLQIMDDLIWSVQPKNSAEERKALVTRLPGLLRALRKGMGEAGLEPNKADAFMKSLAGLHAAAVKNEVVAQPTQTPYNDLDIDIAETMPEVQSKTIRDDSGLAVEEIRLVKQSREMRAAIDQFDEHDSIVKNLKRGTWVEFKRSDGDFLRAKLTFTSPEYGVYVFTNPQIQNAISISREAFVVQLKMGDVVVVPEKSMFDRAMDGLMSKLKASKETA